MPTIIFESGFRIFFYSNDRREPVHVHIEYQDATAKFWINPVRIASNYGMQSIELSRAAFLVKKHEKYILEKWYEFFS